MSGHLDIDSLQLIGVGVSAVLALHQLHAAKAT